MTLCLCVYEIVMGGRQTLPDVYEPVSKKSTRIQLKQHGAIQTTPR